MKRIIESDTAMKEFGERIGLLLGGGECVELIGDVGAGKTTFTKGLARGLAVDEDVQSPSFTISRTYDARDNLKLQHYDFYRLNDPGLMKYELAESLGNSLVVTVLEWAETVVDVLPEHRVKICIKTIDESTRQVSLSGSAELLRKLI